MLMGIYPVLGSFFIITSVTLLQCTETNRILAGVNTPVWIARSENGNVTFERLETGAVKRAYSYFNSDKFQPLRASRWARSLDDHVELAEPHNYEHLARRDAESVGNNRTRSKRYYGDIYNVSILALTQYDASEVKDDASREKYINERILYAISYWDKFNVRVTALDVTKGSTEVHVYLVGIIIALDRGVSPYLNSSMYAKDMLRPAFDFWHQPRAEFPFNAYHAVATMTDVRPWEDYYDFYSMLAGGNNLGNIIIVWDIPNFRAVGRYVVPQVLRQIFGYLYVWSYRREVEVPDYMKPGEEVKGIDPGKLISAEQQCAAAGFLTLERVCSEQSTNCDLYCKNSGFFRFCTNVGQSLEGTPCVNGQVR